MSGSEKASIEIGGGRPYAKQVSGARSKLAAARIAEKMLQPGDVPDGYVQLPSGILVESGHETLELPDFLEHQMSRAMGKMKRRVDVANELEGVNLEMPEEDDVRRYLAKSVEQWENDDTMELIDKLRAEGNEPLMSLDLREARNKEIVRCREREFAEELGILPGKLPDEDYGSVDRDFPEEEIFGDPNDGKSYITTFLWFEEPNLSYGSAISQICEFDELKKTAPSIKIANYTDMINAYYEIKPDYQSFPYGMQTVNRKTGNRRIDLLHRSNKVLYSGAHNKKGVCSFMSSKGDHRICRYGVEGIR
jgi:hypothetical protein